MSADDNMASRPSIDASLVDAVCADLDDAIAGLEGVKLVLVGLASLLRQRVDAARRESTH